MFGKPAETGGSRQSGMEMMITSLLKSMGISADLLRAYIEDGKQLATRFVMSMQAVALGIEVIQREQAAQRAILESIQKKLVEMTTAPGVDELYPAETEVPVCTMPKQ